MKNKPNISFPEIQAEGGVFCLGNPDQGGSCASGNPGERGGGGGNDAIHWVCVDFFWNNPIKGTTPVCKLPGTFPARSGTNHASDYGVGGTLPPDGRCTEMRAMTKMADLMKFS